MADLSSTAGAFALLALGVGLCALVATVLLAIRVGRLRRGQRAVIGDAGERDLVQHSQALGGRLDDLAVELSEAIAGLGTRADDADQRLTRSISHSAVIRYDAYEEMTGRQSSSIALLDDERNGLVLSSILHREQARVYAKPVIGGRSEIDLSPEEREAIEAALSALDRRRAS